MPAASFYDVDGFLHATSLDPIELRVEVTTCTERRNGARGVGRLPASSGVGKRAPGTLLVYSAPNGGKRLRGGVNYARSHSGKER